MSNDGIRTLSESKDGLRPLTPQQEQFCIEYLIDLNGTKAAERAGYAEKSATMQSSRLLRNDNISGRIKQLLDERNTRLKTDADTVLLELLKLAKSDIRKLFNDNGSLKNIADLDDDIAPAIASIEVDELFDYETREKVQIGLTKKVKFWDKPKALELLGKHFALFSEKPEKDSENLNTIKIDLSEVNL